MREPAAPSPSNTHLDPPSLEREVEPTTRWIRRGRNQIAIVAACLAVIAASGAVVWLRVARVWLAADPSPSTAAASPADTIELPTAALASDDPVGPVVAGDIADDTEGWRGVSASPDPFGVVALWDDRTLWVSRDDGRRFHQELAAPEPLGAVTVATDGAVIAARHGGRFGVLTPSGRTRWLRLDYDQALAVAHGGPWTVLLTMSADRRAGLVPMFWATADRGASWRRIIAPAAGDLDNRVRVAADGTIDLLVRATGDLAPRIRLYRGHVDGRPFSAVLDAEDPQPFGLGHDGAPARLVWSGRHARLEPSHLPVADWEVVIGEGSGGTLAVADRKLLALTSTGAETLSDRVPGRPTALTGDGIGRSLAIIGRVAVRHSALHGWRRLFELPGEVPPAP